MKETREENRKIIDIVDEKTFQPALRTGKEKPRLMERKDLFEEGLGWNKVLFGFGFELQMAKLPNTGSPTLSGRQISGYPPASGFRKPN